MLSVLYGIILIRAGIMLRNSFKLIFSHRFVFFTIWCRHLGFTLRQIIHYICCCPFFTCIFGTLLYSDFFGWYLACLGFYYVCSNYKNDENFVFGLQFIKGKFTLIRFRRNLSFILAFFLLRSFLSTIGKPIEVIICFVLIYGDFNRLVSAIILGCLFFVGHQDQVCFIS